MNKTELVAAMAAKAELSKKDAEKALVAFQETVTEELLKGEKVQLVGFGTFEVVDTKERSGEMNGKSWSTPAGKKPKFKAGKAFKESISGK